ncbi:MAG: hypothetical protein PHH40_00830 [Candidatus Moranbacteria bacterium]|nr:hypothetical protein [Candidatus Moranbacteria bacterium]MDD3964858.1 hypothetical protein [Candidatus Moranbacteria bacterium]
MLDTLRQWFVNHKQNIALFGGILLVGVLSFEGGFLRGQISQSAPMIISLPANVESAIPVVSAGTDDATRQTISDGTISTKEIEGNCPLVGSRNSDKYHLFTCAVVKRIKTENRVCFLSKEDAEKRGYVAGCTK